MKTWTCQGYRYMDSYKGEFTVQADKGEFTVQAETFAEAMRKAWDELPFADLIEIEEE